MIVQVASPGVWEYDTETVAWACVRVGRSQVYQCGYCLTGPGPFGTIVVRSEQSHDDKCPECGYQVIVREP